MSDADNTGEEDPRHQGGAGSAAPSRRRGNDPNEVLLAPLPDACQFPRRAVQRSLARHTMAMCDRPGGIDCRNTMTPKHAERLKGGPPKTLPGVQREIDSSTYLT